MPIESEPRRYLPTGAQGEDQTGRAAPTGQVRKRPLIGSVSLGARVTAGHPPLPVRKCRSDSDARSQQSSGAEAVGAARPRIINPGIEPRSRMTAWLSIKQSELLCQRSGSLNVTDRARHEYLSRDKQIEIIAALSEGMGIRATARLTGANRETVGKLALQIGAGCVELHDRAMVGIRVNRLELDELWSFVGEKQKQTKLHEYAKGDQYVFIGMAGTQKAIISYRVGKRDSETTDLFIRDLRERVLGLPEISSDGFLPYQPAIRHAFGNRAAHGVVSKTYSVTPLNVKE